MPISPSELFHLRELHRRGDPMKFAGENTLPLPSSRSGTPCSTRAVLVAHHPGLRAARGDRRELLRHDRHRRRRRDQGHLRRHLRALRPRAPRVAGDAAPGRRRARARSARPSGVGSPTGRAATTRSPTTPTRSSAAWSAASASGCSPRSRKRMAGEFFGNVGDVLGGRPRRRSRAVVGAAAAEAGAMPRGLHRARPGRPARLAGRLPHGRGGRRRAGPARRAAGPSAMMAGR